MSERCASSSYERRPTLFSDVRPEQWGDWHWQQQNRLRRLETIAQVMVLTEEERLAFAGAVESFRVAITPYYATLIDPQEPNCPIRRQALPQSGELLRYSFERIDPLAEEAHMPVPGITHRYPDRVLFYVTHNCPVYCRHCTRKRKVADPSTSAARSQLEEGLDYIRRTHAVRDVLLSGGDPLTLSDARLDDLLSALRKIEHVEIIRLGTRNPVTLPQRITPELSAILRKVRPVYVNTHFNHPREITPEAEHALRLLLDAGCVLGNQMVLLRDINDTPEIVLQLNRRLLQLGCRPYYMLQCDMAEGITHFRTPLQRGLEIMDYLRGRIAGMGVPDFVVDLPGGGGKIELTPDYLLERHPSEFGERLVFRNGFDARFEFIDIAET